MPTSLWHYAGTLRIIDLNENSVRFIPQNISLLVHLEELLLESNLLTSLPYSISTLKRMKRLELKDNTSLYDPPYELVVDFGFKGIWRYLSALHVAPSLKSMVLSAFELVDLKINDMLPTTLEDLSHKWNRLLMVLSAFEQVDLKINDMLPTTLEDLSHKWNRIEYRLSLFDLEALSLDDNRFIEVPQQVMSLTRLTLLSLARNFLESLTEQVSQLTSLTVLHLESNKLSTLPENLSLATGLCKLTVHQNTALQADGLRKLTVHQNTFTEFPEVLLTLSVLEVLNLSKNALETLPAKLPASCKGLRDLGALGGLILLDLAHNNLELANNNLVSLPDSLPGCARLRALYLDTNPISVVPAGVLRLARLQRLRLSGTNITGLPPKLGLLTGLKQ
ncbi:hypothetical protein T484DRAFT_1780638, partial [Baffinella frigidus]